MKSPSEGYNQLQKYLRHCAIFWHKWPVHDLVLVMPPPPPIDEQLSTGGRREISIISHRPVTSSDLKQERSFFRGSVSTCLQLVVATSVKAAGSRPSDYGEGAKRCVAVMGIPLCRTPLPPPPDPHM